MSSQKKNLPLESVIFKYLNSPLTTAVPSQWSRFWFRNCAEKDSKVTILHLKDNIYIKIRNKKGTQKRFSYEELRYSETELTFPNTKDFFATLHHPFLLNKLTPKSWVANGVPILFQTLILEKLMLHQYFKQHSHIKKGFQISLLKCKVPGWEIFRFSQNERKNGMILGIKWWTNMSEPRPILGLYV